MISETQSTFVKERQILDGVLIANEVVDEARKLKKELMLFKVDFEKAYDYVDWSYLDEVMRKMTFLILWRKWIKECVSTATTSVLVNGSPTDEFPWSSPRWSSVPFLIPVGCGEAKCCDVSDDDCKFIWGIKGGGAKHYGGFPSSVYWWYFIIGC